MKKWVGLTIWLLWHWAQSQAHGDIFGVSNLADTTSLGSLRGAIIEANRRGGENVIVLANPRYELTLAGIDENGARTGDLDVTRGHLTIVGYGVQVRIDATALDDRIFHVLPGARLTLIGIVLAGGRAFGDAYADYAHFDGEAGGGLYNEGLAILRNCEVTENASGGGGDLLGNGFGGWGGPGGGVFNTGTLTLEGCLIRGNVAGHGGRANQGGNGGGIANMGTCCLIQCLVAGNTSGSGGGADAIGIGGQGGNGGGIHNSGTMTLLQCTIFGNLTGSGSEGNLPSNSQVYSSGGPGGNGGLGAGIYNTGTLDINLSTISGNTNGAGGTGGNGWEGGPGGRGGSGGGVFNVGTLAIESSTISQNHTGRGGDQGYDWGESSMSKDGPGGDGGGVFTTDASMARLENSLIALNATSAAGTPGTNRGTGTDLRGSFHSLGYNLIGIADGAVGLTNGVLDDHTGSMAFPLDPRLGPLGNYGGFFPTHSLLPGSPAIDQGRAPRGDTDQRGHVRPHDFATVPNAVGGDGSDIGSFESDLPALSLKQRQDHLIVSWDASCPEFVLETTTNLNSLEWSKALGVPFRANVEIQVTNLLSAPRKFFRLRRD